MNAENIHIDVEILGKPEGGFTIPEGYFVKMQEDILRKTSANGFSVPSNYFETLEERILQRVRKPRVIHLQTTNFRKIAVGIAASLLLISGFFLLKNQFYKTAATVQFSEIKINDLSDEDIINYVDLSDIKDAHIAGTALKSGDKTLKQEEEEYLINNADEQLIVDEL